MQAKMNFCLITGIFPPDIGGPATYVSKLANYFISIGYHVEVITYADSSAESDTLFAVHKIIRKQSGIRKYLQTKHLVEEVASRSNIAYLNGLLIPASSALANKAIPKVAKIVGDPVWERSRNDGLTLQDFEEFQSSKQSIKIRFLQYLRNNALERMDKIIVPSQFLRKVVENWGFDGKVELIYNGIEQCYGQEFLKISREESKRRLGFNGWVLISIGRLCNWKGFDAIISSLKKLRDDTSLVIVGDGPDQKRLEEITHIEGVGRRVIFAGRIEHQKLPLYLRASDCFILNSGYEGFPHIILEALKMECPVIAANRGGTPELIKDGVNGILVAKDSVKDIVISVERIREDSVFRSSIIANGIENTKLYTWEMTAEKTRNLLEKMV